MALIRSDPAAWSELLDLGLQASCPHGSTLRGWCPVCVDQDEAVVASSVWPAPGALEQRTRERDAARDEAATWRQVAAEKQRAISRLLDAQRPGSEPARRGGIASGLVRRVRGWWV
jgi:hypothetical protein